MNFRKHDLDTKELEARGWRVLEDAALLLNMRNEGLKPEIYTVVSFKELPFPAVNALVSIPIDSSFNPVTLEEIKRQQNRIVGKVISFPAYRKVLVETALGNLTILLNDIVILEDRKCN